jgi:hypothetical protein
MSPRPRTVLSAALIVLSCLLVPFAALAVWAAYGLTDTGRYVRTMAPLAAHPAVRDEVADTVGEGLARRLNAARAQPQLTAAVRSFTGTAAFRAGWDQANRSTHDAVLRALHGRDAGPVVVDLAPVTARVERQLAADRVPVKLPEIRARVAVVPADELGRMREGLRMLEIAAFWLPSAAAVLAVTGIAVATCRRRAVTATALGTALGGALLGLAVALGRRLTVADLPAEVSTAAAGAVYDALTTTLRSVSWLLSVLGLAVAVAAWLTGRATRPTWLMGGVAKPTVGAGVTVGDPDATLAGATLTAGDAGVTVGGADATLAGAGLTAGDAGVTVGGADATLAGAGLTAGDAGVTVGDPDATLAGAGLTDGGAGVTVGGADATLAGAGLTAGSADVALGSAGLTAGSADVTLAGAGLTTGDADATLAGAGLPDGGAGLTAGGGGGTSGMSAGGVEKPAGGAAAFEPPPAPPTCGDQPASGAPAAGGVLHLREQPGRGP